MPDAVSPPALVQRVVPSADAARGAFRAGLTLAAPLVALAATGRMDVAVYATFGAFAGVYGGPRRTARRWRLQLAAGLLLSSAVLGGVMTATLHDRAWVAVPVASCVAAGGSLLSDRWRWVPPGPMFLVFAYVTSASIPADAALVVLAAVVVSSTAAVAVVLGVIEVAWLGVQADPMNRFTAARVRQQGVQAARCAAAVGLAGVVVTTIGIDHPYWAMVAAVVPLAAPDLRLQLVRGTHRVLGTVVGLGLSSVLLLVPLSTVAFVMVVALLQTATELWVARIYGLALVFITPMALLVVQRAHPEPVDALLAARLLETVIGVGIGVLLAVVTCRFGRAGSAPA